MSIPRLIHFVWIGPPMTNFAQRNIAEFRRLNPDYEVMVHGMEAMHPDYESIVDSLSEQCGKADLIRLSVLEKYGGWYFDTDYWPLRPVADAERAWDLDGSKLFLSRAWVDNKNPGFLGNGVMAGSQDCPAWAKLKRYAIENTDRKSRLAYGPLLVRRFYERHPDETVIACDAWFNGVKAPRSTDMYQRLIRGEGRDDLRRHRPETSGQLPFAMHLWAWKYTAELEAPPKPRVKRAAVVCLSTDPPSKASVFTALANGIRECGYEVKVIPYTSTALRDCGETPELLTVWNGLKHAGQRIDAECRKLGIPTLKVEYGWFERANYFQVDHCGILHHSSLKFRLHDPAPESAYPRLYRHVGHISPMKCRDGYVLVIGQVTGDSQMFDSEKINRVGIQNLVRSNLNNVTDAYYRPHPKESGRWHNDPLPHLPGRADLKDIYRKTMTGVGLDEALAGARFIVTINSNTITEALVAGVPCLAFGPSLAIEAGVAHKTTIRTFDADFRDMMDGWMPQDAQVGNYLAWLAASQWTREELATKEVMEPLVNAALTQGNKP